MNRARGFLGAAVLSILILTGGCSGAYSPRSMFSEGKLEGNQRFNLKNLNGENVSLDGLLGKNKAVLVNFWATWCPFCIEETPDLVKLKTKYKDSPFEIVGINVGESKEEAAAFAKRLHINYTVLLDEDNSVAQSYHVVGIPTTFLISAQGKIVGEYHAFTSQLESDVEKVLQT